MSSKYKVVIPPEAREALGSSAGDELLVLSKPDRVVIVPRPKKFAKHMAGLHAGVFRANRAAGPLDSSTEMDGSALEGLVAQHLQAWCDYSRGKHTLHYWQTRSRNEVDFVIYGESGIYAIEVKNAARADSSAFASLRHFAEDYPQSRRYLLYRGNDRFTRDGVLCMPCEEFLRTLQPDGFPD